MPDFVNDAELAFCGSPGEANSRRRAMGYKDPTYVVFDGDNDKWAYAYMKGWKKNQNIDFDFRDAHDIDSMRGRRMNNM